VTAWRNCLGLRRYCQPSHTALMEIQASANDRLVTCTGQCRPSAVNTRPPLAMYPRARHKRRRCSPHAAATAVRTADPGRAVSPRHSGRLRDSVAAAVWASMKRPNNFDCLLWRCKTHALAQSCALRPGRDLPTSSLVRRFCDLPVCSAPWETQTGGLYPRSCRRPDKSLVRDRTDHLSDAARPSRCVVF